MHYRRLPVWAVSTLAVLAAPQLAVAGPIDWSYSVDTNAGNGLWVGFGVEYQTTLDPVTGEEVSTPYRLLANIARGGQGTGSDSGTARVGAFSPADLHTYSIDDQWALTRPGVFDLVFNLTDSASGQTRSLTYGVSGESHGFFTTGSGVVTLFPDPQVDTFVLGGNRYTVRPVARQSESAAYLDLDVTVGPVAATPEPTTLVLAGVGLAAAGWRRRVAKSAR